MTKGRLACFVAGTLLVAMFVDAGTVNVCESREFIADPADKGNYGYQVLGRERILLMNEDRNNICPVTSEGYVYNEDVSPTFRRRIEAYWTWVEEDRVSLYNLKDNSSSELHISKNGQPGECLWSLHHCRHGNTHSSSVEIQKVSNYLPHSTTSMSIGSTGSTVATDDTAGQIVMQNTPEAQVVSPCYQEGIGTVYFDAVNAFTGYQNGQIAVEVAFAVFKTNVSGRVVGRRIPEDLETDADGNLTPPDDAHCDEVCHVAENVPETNRFCRLAWIRVNSTGRLNKNGTIVALPTNDVVTLAVETGNSSENFYRVWAPIANAGVNPDIANYARGPMRFRIKRLDNPAVEFVGISLDGENLGTHYASRNGLLLVDNVIASYPAMKAWAVPRGDYVNGGSPRNIIGWSGATLPKNYPAAGETDLKAAAGLAFATNNPAQTISDWIGETKAVMLWRSRYLNQVISGDWSVLPLSQTGDGYVSNDYLALPSSACDIEFKYETLVDAPYYDYVDYSGSSGMAGTPGYSERIEKVSTVFNPDALGSDGIPLVLPSGGRDFFFRLREGVSYQDQLEFRVQVRPYGKECLPCEYPCSLMSNGVWQGVIKTTTNETSATALPCGTYEFRVVGADPQNAFGGNPFDEIPSAGLLHRESANVQAWTRFSVDSETGALVFLLTEDWSNPAILTCEISHADCQDFNLWTDVAISAERYYACSFFEGRGRALGGSPDTREYVGDLAAWSSPASANAVYWTECFKLSPGMSPLQGFGGYGAYEEFARCRTPNGWFAESGNWACYKWSESAVDSPMALQLQGDGRGSLAYQNQSALPQGIESINFSARLAERQTFEDFATYCGAPIGEMKDYLVSARTIMSTTDDSTEFDGNGSVSLVGYYQPNEGCYELRAERIAKNAIRLCLYKWRLSKRTVTAQLLGYHNTSLPFQTGTYLRCSNRAQTVAEQASAYFGELFMRCRTVDGQTVVTVGVLNGSRKLSDSCSNVSHYLLTYTDTEVGNPLTFGTFGFGSINCPAQFARMNFWTNGNGGSFPTVSGKPKDADGRQINDANFRCGSGTVIYPSIESDVFCPGVSSSKYGNWAWRGTKYQVCRIGEWNGVSAIPLAGSVDVFLTEPIGNGETKCATVEVSGFGTVDYCVQVQSREKSGVRFATAADSDDIVVSNVSFGQYCASGYADGDDPFFADKQPEIGCPADFVYLGGNVQGGEGEQVLALQPARARQGEIVGVRSPLMDGTDGRGIGLGSISISYRDADPDCVLLVQYAEMDSTSELKSRSESVSGWTTVARFDFSNMSAESLSEGVLTAFIGACGSKGVMRMIVDPNVVEAASDETINTEQDIDYGSITLTAVRCRDNPSFDGRCWSAWNLRTTDDPFEISIWDSADIMMPGLALILNNSLITDVDPYEQADYGEHPPYVQSPVAAIDLFDGISFYARKLSEDSPAGTLTVFGLKTGGGGVWQKVASCTVDSMTFERFSFNLDEKFCSFRLAIPGVVSDPTMPDDSSALPVRIVLDDMIVSEHVEGFEPPPLDPETEAVWSCGFEEFDEGESENLGSHIALPDGDDGYSAVVTSYTSSGLPVYQGLLPGPFDSSGNNYLKIKTGSRGRLWIAGSEVGQSLGSRNSLYVDAVVRMTLFDEEPAIPDFLANPSPQFMLNSVVTPQLRVEQPGFLIMVDDKLMMYALEVYDENEEVVGTNLCLVAGQAVGSGSEIKRVTHLLAYDDGSGVPDVADSWCRLTVQMSEQEETGIVVFRIFVNGRLLCDTAGKTEFPSLSQNSEDSQSLKTVSFMGQGMIDDIVFGEGEPQFENQAVAAIAAANENGGEVVVVGGSRLPEVELKTGVTIRVSPEVGEVLDDESLRRKISALPTESDQPADCFTVKSAKAETGAVELSVALDEDVVKAEETLAEAVDANNLMELQTLTAGEESQISFENVRPGLYYALGVSGEISGLKTAVEQAPRVKATQDGVTLPIVKPEGSSVFMQMSVSDKK